MPKLFEKTRDTEDTLFFNDLDGKNCHFFQDTNQDTAFDGYLWFPAEGASTPLSSYLGCAGASVCPPHRGR